MTWKEAISRSLRALLAFAIIYILGIVLIGIAAGLFVAGSFTEVWVLFLPAVALYIVGLVVFIMGSFAVMLKLLTDAIVDHVTERLASGQSGE